MLDLAHSHTTHSQTIQSKQIHSNLGYHNADDPIDHNSATSYCFLLAPHIFLGVEKKICCSPF